jgi:hypothetical protein
MLLAPVLSLAASATGIPRTPTPLKDLNLNKETMVADFLRKYDNRVAFYFAHFCVKQE